MRLWKTALGLVSSMLLVAPALSEEPTATLVYFQSGSRIEPAIEGAKIPYTAQQILFDLSDPHGGARGGRVRYKLEGVDSDWIQKADDMSLTVTFYNAKGDQVGQKIFNVRGSSAGWNGSIEQSTFAHRREVLAVPPEAEHFGIVISSAGPPTSVGVYIVDGIRIEEKGSAKTIFDSKPFQQGTAAPDGQWIRTGKSPSMASLMPRAMGDSAAKVFCIQDDDAGSYAEWLFPWANSPRLTPGQTLSLEWNEIYETGMINSARLRYAMPAPGHYRFTAQEVDLFGHPRPMVNRVEITVLPPYWKDPRFWAKCGTVAACFAFMGVRYWGHTKRRLQLERARLVDLERMRIARDLHDDLGARLTHISLMSAFAGSQAQSDSAGAKFREIAAMSRDLVASLSEVVWAVNPENDRLESMVHYLCQEIQRLCNPSPLKCRIDELTDAGEYMVPSQLRHNIVMATKEAVNNAIKHSGATELHARIRFCPPRLTISIADNGHGMPDNLSTGGNGLQNIQERVRLVDGHVNIESTLGKGTVIHFEVPISTFSK